MKDVLMKLKEPFKNLSLLILILGITSCNRYIDSVKTKTTTSIMQGYFDFYPADSNVLFYKTNIGLKRDTEVTYPKAFTVKLPKGLKFYEFSSTDFGFYYNNNQVVFMKVNVFDSIPNRDTFYFPKEAELNDFILNKIFTTNGKYNIKNISMNQSRKQAMIKKGAATILLYNIKPENYDLFLKDVSSFSFIDK